MAGHAIKNNRKIHIMMFIKKAIALCECFNYVGNLVTMAKDENVSTQAPQGQTAGFKSKSFFL